jgi:AcrR family transcriptional regulator
VGLPSCWTARERPRARRCRLTSTRAPQERAASPRRRARRGEGALLREEILAAAEEILIESRDQDAVSIRAVADAVGVTPPSIYLHFADKNELLFEVCQRHFARLEDVLHKASQTTTDPLERITRLGLAYLAFGLENPEHYRILFLLHPKESPVDVGSEELEEMTAFGVATQAVQECMDAGLIRRGDVRVTAIGLWVMIHGLVSLFVSKQSIDWGDQEALAEALCHQHLYGLLTEEARGRYAAGIPSVVTRERGTPAAAEGGR